MIVVTGNCLCSGIMGVMLGGGHGFLQGFYGLVADQIVKARVVLADGSAVTVSSESNNNLFWALRGAGHNFGIVTGLEFKVYNAGSATTNWTHVDMFFKGDQLEQVFSTANELLQDGNQPAKLIFWGAYRHAPSVDPVNVS